MTEEDRYCLDGLHQISAIRSALDWLGVELLASHLETSITVNSRSQPTLLRLPENEAYGGGHE
jgi:DNA-binding FrmR family transcriptional regulator